MPYVLASTGQPFSREPAISLWNFIKDNWTLTDPPVDQIKFDTKFENMSGLYFVSVFPVNTVIQDAEIGLTARQTIMDFKRIYILARGHSARDKRWKMEEHILDICNLNATGLLADGIEEIHIDEFQPVGGESAKTATGISDSSLSSMSFARIMLKYDKVAE